MGSDFAFVSVYVEYLVFDTDDSPFASVVRDSVTWFECFMWCHFMEQPAGYTNIFPRIRRRI
jgi:8-oxo-dGTP pyrophosphatase MutT (NUDIX family)